MAYRARVRGKDAPGGAEGVLLVVMDSVDVPLVSPPTHALRPRRRCSARPLLPFPFSLFSLVLSLTRLTPSAAEQQRIPLGVRLSRSFSFFLCVEDVMAYLCILMGRRRAAFSRPFARPLASRLTDDESTEPTPRTLYSLLSLCLPSSLEITRDCTHTHTPPHQPAFYHIPPSLSLSLSVQAPRICPPRPPYP